MAQRARVLVRQSVLLTGILFLFVASPVLAEPESRPIGAAGSTIYVVKPGDTLYSVARRHHTSLSSLVQANGLSDPNLIFAHQLLTVLSDRPRIRVTSPAAGASVVSPVTIMGESDTFEGHVALRVLDANLQVVGQGWATGGNLGVYGPFTADLSFTVAREQEGVLEAWWDSPENGVELDTVSIPVHLSLSGSSATRTYVVRRGDNLYRIALRFGTTVHAIVAANGISDPDLVYVGQVLQIP